LQNWPRRKKELHFWALLLAAGLANGTKTALVPVNANVMLTFGVSYTAAAGLTAVPLIIAAFAAIASTTLARMRGKRPVYLTAVSFLLFGCVWNACASSYGSCMGARIFQGLGWGAFDVLLLGSIQDTYFVSQVQIHPV
jgi:predicted MFS family arabinose efflux permease